MSGAKRNERTSSRVARIAAKVLAMTPVFVPCRRPFESRIDLHCMVTESEWSDIRALAASCLTQTAGEPRSEHYVRRVTLKGKRVADKPKRKRRKA